MVLSKTLITLLTFLSCILLASRVGSKKTISKNEFEKTNIYFPEEMLLKYNDKPYVRVYQAIFEQQEGVQTAVFNNEYPPSTVQFKDIFQDNEGNIIIYPNQRDVNNKLYFGIGDYRNQIKFMDSYKNPNNDNPMIKSFIVPYEIIYEIARGIVGEKKAKEKEVNALKMSNACDLKYVNQFGLNRFDVDLLKAYALPNSLVTFVEKDIKDKIGHLGLIKKIHMIPPNKNDRSCFETLWDAKGIPDHEDKQEDVLKILSDLKMDEIPKIKESVLETGIDDNMLDQSEKYRTKWEGAKRFLRILEAFGQALINDKNKKEKSIDKIKGFNSAKKILQKVYGKEKGEQKQKQIEGGFLAEFDKLDDAKKTANKLYEIVIALIDKAKLTEKKGQFKVIDILLEAYKDKINERVSL